MTEPEDWVQAILVVGVIFVAGLAVGCTLESKNNLIEECRKENNVYECILIAIPKTKREIYQGAYDYD